MDRMSVPQNFLEGKEKRFHQELIQGQEGTKRFEIKGLDTKDEFCGLEWSVRAIIVLVYTSN